jgi:serine/threonine protein kinase
MAWTITNSRLQVPEPETTDPQTAIYILNTNTYATFQIKTVSSRKQCPIACSRDVSQLIFCSNSQKQNKIFTLRFTIPKTVAVKTVNQAHAVAQNHVGQVERERAALKALNGKSRFIVRMLLAVKDEENVYFVMECAMGAELHRHIRTSLNRRLSLSSTRFYTCQISSALQTIHENGFVYRDLKASNVMLSGAGHVVLVDFGLAKDLSECEDQHTSTFCGTRHAMPPEIIRHEKHSFAVDNWALGVLIYEMITGAPPFPYVFSARGSWSDGKKKNSYVTVDQESATPLEVIEQVDKLILQGVDAIKFDPELFSCEKVSSAELKWGTTMGSGGLGSDAKLVIEGLLQADPTKRLALDDFSEQNWFQAEDDSDTFDWDTVVEGLCDAPEFDDTISMSYVAMSVAESKDSVADDTDPFAGF